MLEVEPVLILRNVYGGPTNLDDSEGTRCGSLGQRLLIKKKKKCRSVPFVCCYSHNASFLQFRDSLIDHFKNQRLCDEPHCK